MHRTPAIVAALVLLTASLLTAVVPAAAQGDAVPRAREMVDAGQPEAALELLDKHLRHNPEDAEALLVRSTARFMTGAVDAGRGDLERSLELDPAQRQGWLNLAALAVSEERYADALEAFRRAEELDPAAPENDLNIGAVLLLQGQLEPASERFALYLEAAGSSADGYYLVATNYALAGYEALASQHLRRAIELDERMRLRARTDPNFSPLAETPRFQQLLNTDLYRPPAGSHRAAQSYGASFDGGDGLLLPAVLDALQLSGRTFDPRVEVTPGWALIWSDLRIKVSDRPDGRGQVELSAPAERFTPAEWKTSSEELLRRIARQAALRTPREEDSRGNEPR